jgi:hypothetical protein
MYHCERCQSRFNSQRAAFIRDCPRCLLRDDVASPLVPGSPPRRDEAPADAGTAAPSPEGAAGPDSATGAGAPPGANEAFPAVPAG